MTFDILTHIFLHKNNHETLDFECKVDKELNELQAEYIRNNTDSKREKK
jgi:hypothetical protein